MTITKIKKRSGRVVKFRKEKVERAIGKAFRAVGEKDGQRVKYLAGKVVEKLERRFKEEIPHVEQVQDTVEEVLMRHGHTDVARAYILYRDLHARIRSIYSLVDSDELMENYLNKSNWLVRENANMAYSLQGLNNHVASIVSANYWLNKIYTPQIRQAHTSGDFHIHDLQLLATYTFFGREVVIVKLNNEIQLTSFAHLYDEIKEEETLLNKKDQAYAKYPKGLEILDEKGWVKVQRLVRKRKEREMLFVKNENGRSLIVTDNHPFIVKRKGERREVEARKILSEEDLVLSCNLKKLLQKEKLFFRKELYLAEEFLKEGVRDFFLDGFAYEDFIKNCQGSPRVSGTISTANTANGLDNKLILSQDLGYLLGIYLAEGNYHYQDYGVTISLREKKLLEKVKRIAAKLGIRAYYRKEEKEIKGISLANKTLNLVFKKIFKIQGPSWNKNLPPEILSYNLDFVKGVIGGIIDGDGSLSGNKTQIIIRVSSRTMLEQIAVLLSLLGFVPRDRAVEGQGSKRVCQGREIIQRYPLYGISFSKKKGISLPSLKYEEAKAAKKHWRAKDPGWHKILNLKKVNIPEEDIYDITTESGTLLVNGILAHNCCGWDLYDLLIKGFGGVSGKIECKPAKHFRTALGQLVNFMYTLQGECYSEDTQVLTDSGWKYFFEVTKDDKVFTLNNQTNEIELQKPVRFYEFAGEGKLYHFKSKKLDLLVTPNHRMVVDQYYPNCKKRYHRKMVKAKDFDVNNHFIPKHSLWQGIEEKFFILPGIEIQQYRNFGQKYEVQELKPKKILMDDWLAFFGFWLAEGSTSKRKRKRKGRRKLYYEYAIRITQNEGKKADEFERVLKRLPFNYNKKIKDSKIEFVIYDKQLFFYLKQFGKAGEKFIPQEIKSLSKRQLRILFDWLMKGDGYEGGGNTDYYTKSRRLADDVQELVLKLGWNANIYERKKSGFRWYKVSISKTRYFKLSSNPGIKTVDYQGKVFCLEVPNHTLYVRRKGKACWCGNSAGAQAVSSFDTLLAPFIRADKLSYKEVKQAMQEFLFNMNVPTRVGFQCVSEDTEILTPKGWKTYEEIKRGSIIRTFNLKTHKIEDQKVTDVFKKKYKGIMYRLRNRIQDQLISPGHRVVRRKFNSSRLVLEPIEEVLKLKSPFIIPIGAENQNKEAKISDEQIKLMAWIISEGTVERPTRRRCCYRVSIYQSKIKNKGNYEEIANLLDHFKLKYSVYKATSLGDEVYQFRLNAESSRKIHQWFGTRESVHFIPDCLLNLSKRQSRLFLETYLKGDGFEGCKISTTDLELLDGLQMIIVAAGYGFTVLKRKPTIGRKSIYVLRIIRHQETYISKVEKVNYQGVIWCPHTKNETIIARRKGKVFITGNTPFSNVTLDLTPSSVWKDSPVIIGGKPQSTTYGDYQKEMNMFNRAFAEVMLEGDAKGRVFTFPIPTYNITHNFAWDNPTYKPIWEMTRKYGIPYFCLTEDTTVYKNHGGLTPIKKIKKGDRVLTEDGYQEVEQVFRLKTNKIIKLSLEDGGEVKATPNHRFPVAGGRLKKVEELSLQDRLLRIIPETIILSSGLQLGPATAGLIEVYTLKNDKLQKAESLHEGEVVFLRSLFKFGDKKDLSKFSFKDSIYANNTKLIKTPKLLTPSLSRFLGYLLGDGSYYGRGKKLPLITFTNANKEVVNDFIEIVKSTFGENLTIHSRMVGKNKKTQSLSISSRVLRELLLFLGLKYQKHREKEVPALIFETTKENITNFLLGIFEADGYIDKKGNISFSSTSKNLVQGIQRLLFFLGIFSRVKPQGSVYKLYLLGNAAQKFAQEVGFISQKKLKRIKQFLKDRPNLGDYQGLNSILKKLVSPFKRNQFSGKEKLIWEKINYRHRAKITHSELGVVLKMTSQFRQTSSYQTLKEIYKNNLFCDKVSKKERQRKEETRIVSIERLSGDYSVVDLSIKSASHLFLINGGILTHNSNFINSDMKPEDVRSMCCRLRLSYRTLKKRGGGLFGANPLTGSLGVITINMPRIGFLAKDEKEYFARLSRLMDLAKEALLIKRRVLEKFTDQGLYPYSRVYLSGIKERFGSYWKNHFSTIGLNGMNESLLNFMGKTIGDKEGRAFALEVLEFMRQKLLIFQKETGEMFNLEATPAEGTSYRLAMLDKKLYPKMICANERAYQEEGVAPYYTNSTQLPVNFTDDIFEALELQDELQTKYTGGTVLHGFLGESLPNGEMVKRLVKKIAENYHLPYFTLTPTFSICPQCGYLKGEHQKCPKCNRVCEIFSRIVGYLRPVSQWNEGKQSEFRQRKTFKIKPETS